MHTYYIVDSPSDSILENSNFAQDCLQTGGKPGQGIFVNFLGRRPGQPAEYRGMCAAAGSSCRCSSATQLAVVGASDDEHWLLLSLKVV